MTATPAVPSEPPLTDEALAEIEARAEAATPGPWDMAIHTHPLASCRCGSCTTDPIGYAVDHKLANYCDDIVAGSDDIDGCDKGPLLTYADASFAAAAREDVPRLVASLRSARKELEAARVVTTLYAWTGGGQETERELALFQAWHEYVITYGTPNPSDEWDQRIADLAARRRARQAEVRAGLAKIVTTEEGTDRGN